MKRVRAAPQIGQRGASSWCGGQHKPAGKRCARGLDQELALTRTKSRMGQQPRRSLRGKCEHRDGVAPDVGECDIVEKDGPIVTWGAGAASEAAPALARVTAVATLRQHRGKKKGAGIGRAQKVPKEEDENTERDRPMPSPLILQERCQEPPRPKSTSYGIVPVLEVS